MPDLASASTQNTTAPVHSQPRRTSGGRWPTLDGLRGIAIALVVIFHCRPRLEWLAPFAAWGWIGINLFFVLSGFLITGILLEARAHPDYFRNFYARRALRIWPVYVLLLALQYGIVPLIFTGLGGTLHGMLRAPWWAYMLFAQNLFHLNLPPALGPTWSLAIEEQFYLFWAPLVRWIRTPALVLMAVTVVVASPWLRMHGRGLTSTNTLFHLDGLATGALLAMAWRRFPGSRAGIRANQYWRACAWAGLAAGVTGMAIALQRGIAYLDTLLALGFAGMLILALLSEDRPNWYGRALSLAPLRFLGRISYSLYMLHILVFVMLGSLDLRLDRYGATGNFAIVAMRSTVSIAVATSLWYGFERPILTFKRRFGGVRAES